MTDSELSIERNITINHVTLELALVWSRIDGQLIVIPLEDTSGRSVVLAGMQLAHEQQELPPLSLAA